MFLIKPLYLWHHKFLKPILGQPGQMLLPGLQLAQVLELLGQTQAL
jgi:hypothetical protein